MKNKNSYWSKKTSQVENFGGLQTVNSFNKLGKFMFWRNKVITSNKNVTIKKINWIYLIFGALVVSLLLYGLSNVQFGTTRYGTKQILGNFAKMFSFNENAHNFNGNMWSLSFKGIIKTIQITITGTLVGAMLALITSFLSARNLTPWYVNKPIRLILSFFRTLPPMVFALIFASGFKPEMASMLTLCLFTWAILNKLMYEEIENTSLSAYESLIAAGNNKILAFRETVLKKIMPKFVSLAFYSFEINLRISTVLGIIGGGLSGIGAIMGSLISSQDWQNIGIPLVVLVLTIMLIEFLSTLMRVFVFEKNLNQIDAKALNNFTNEKKYYIDYLNNLYTDKIKKSKSKAKTLKLKNTLAKKIAKINNKYQKIDEKIVNKIQKDELINLKMAYDEKVASISKIYNKKIENAQLKKNHNREEKLIAAKEQLLFDLQVDYKKQISILDNALRASQRVLFTNKKSPSTLFTKSIILLTIFALTVWSMSILEFGMIERSTFSQNLSFIFKPDWSMFGGAFSDTLEALMIAFLATCFGGVMAFFVGMAASRKVTSKYVSPVFSFLIIVIRVVPSFVVATMIVPGMIDGRFAAVLALSIHSIGMVGKLTREQFNNIKSGPQQSIRSAGGTKIDEIRYGVFPQVVPNIMSVIIYRFEINIKTLTEIGFITQGISAMGFNLKLYLQNGRDEPSQYAKAYSYIWSIIIVIIFVEFLSNILRSYILTGLLPKWLYTIKKTLNRKKIIKNSILLKSLKYDVSKLSGDQILVFANLEKQAALDENIDVMFFQNKYFKELVKTNEELFVLQNKFQFGGYKSKEMSNKILTLKKRKKILLIQIKEFAKNNKSKINKITKENLRNSFVANRGIQKQYKSIYAKYLSNIKKTRHSASAIVKEAATKLKATKTLGDSAEIYKQKKDLRTAKKIKTKIIKLAKSKPIHNFF